MGKRQSAQDVSGADVVVGCERIESQGVGEYALDGLRPVADIPQFEALGDEASD